MKNKQILLTLIVATFIVVVPLSAEVIIYSQGFEADDGAYTHTGTLDQWEWGMPDAAFLSGPVFANSGLKCWGTDLDDHVPYNSDSYLTSPAIAIPPLGTDEVVRVRFYGWIAVDIMNDRGEFQVSSDGVTWETKAELLNIMQGGWTEYYFDVSSYAGGDLYLRFRCRADDTDYFYAPGSVYNMAGLYIDDVAVIIAEAPSIKTTVTLEAWEDQSSYSSCPWVYTWDGSEFVKDNDVYSTARGADKEYTDFYLLNKPPAAVGGKYLIELRETDDEKSYTDMVSLATVDHAADVSIAPDNNGNILTYSAPISPVSAIDDQGNDVLAALATADGIGASGYNEDTIVLDFSNADITDGATLVLRVKGFLDDGGDSVPTLVAPPAVYIETQDADGQWVVQNIFWPRWKSAVMAYDLKDALSVSQTVRLSVVSCHENKYHLIDYAGLDVSAQKDIVVNNLTVDSAIQSINGDVTAPISSSDDVYAFMGRSESISLEFTAPEDTGLTRDFVLVSEGYYIPDGTYFIYTWDGTQWAQRDGWTIEGSGDQTRTFDLSLWLPDPDGQWKVRIWQDYFYNGAGIDYVGITRGAEAGVMNNAYDLKYEQDVTSKLTASDDDKDEWTSYDQVRNRWVEVLWDPFEINTPPTVDPVAILNPTSSAPTITWTYNDADGDAQTKYEVEVWTGPGGTGVNVWDPPSGVGTTASVVYAGSALLPGQTYYARVKAYDGTAWGAWSQGSWTVPDNAPPVAVCQNVTVPAGDGCQAMVTAEDVNNGSYDPDGDPITLSLDPAGPYSLGDTSVTLTVSDGELSSTCQATVTVVDGTAPEITCPDDIAVSGGYGGTIVTYQPTASDGCDPNPTVTTDIPSGSVFEIGVTTITVTATDASGNSSTCTFDVIVSCFALNDVRIKADEDKDKGAPEGDDIRVKGTFSPAVPIDLAVDDVLYVIDDGQGYVAEFLIPAGSFAPIGEGGNNKFKFQSPKNGKPAIDAKFDFGKCRFELTAKEVTGLGKITSSSLTVTLQSGVNLGQETVELKINGNNKDKHFEYRARPKLECCQSDE